MKSATVRLSAAAFLVLAAGCSFFSRTHNDVYALEVIPGTVIDRSGPPVGIGALELPPGIDRREIVVRKSAHELDVRGTDLWPATFSDVVLHTLAFDLASRLPAGAFVLPGESPPATVRSIDIAFQEIAAGPETRVVLDARWNGQHERIEVPIANLDSATVAAGVSQGLATLADRIAASLT